jgi:hypothetical protein
MLGVVNICKLLRDNLMWRNNDSLKVVMTFFGVFCAFGYGIASGSQAVVYGVFVTWNRGTGKKS